MMPLAASSPGPVLLPFFVLAVGAMVVLLLGVAGGERRLAPAGGHHLLVVTCLSFLLAARALWYAGQQDPAQAASARALGQLAFLSHALVFDGVTLWFGLLTCLGGLLAAMLSFAWLCAHGMAAAEYLALLLLAAAGALGISMAGDLLSLFLSIEIMSVAAYVLAGYRRAAAASQEAALKYFVFGAFASALMVLGIALAWGESGRVSGHPTLVLHDLAYVVKSGDMTSLGQVGLLFVLSGLCFKVAAVPFHMWAPDVYEGAPTPASAFLSVVVKAAAFSGLVRFVHAAFAPLTGGQAHAWMVQLFWGLAAASVVVGNLLIVRQNQVKRLLAYSSIAQAGYVLMGLVALVDQPAGAALPAMGFYLLCYTGMALGAFGLVMALEGRHAPGFDFDLERLAGAGRRAPVLGLCGALFFFGLAGIPPTGGFLGKARLFAAVLAAGHVGLVVLAALASVVGAYGYLRVVAVLLLRRAGTAPVPVVEGWLLCGLLLCASLVLGLGLLPEAALALAGSTLGSFGLRM